MECQLPHSTSSSNEEEMKMMCYAFKYATVMSSPPKRQAGRTKFQETRHPVFRGVHWRGKGERWVCELRDPNKNSKKSRIWLGTFPTAEMAARAHDMAAMALRGRNACLNFADSAWRLTLPCSASRDDIRKAASMAAEMFRPLQSSDETDADQEQSTLMSESDCSTSKPVTVGVCNDGFDAAEFSSDAYDWDAAFTEQISNYSDGYCMDDHDMEYCVADVSLWSYSI